MSLEHRIQRIPRNRPDITPVIYGDSSAASAIKRVNSPEGIDAFVYHLRAEFFRQWLGYEPPLVADRPIFSKTMAEARYSNLLVPENYASALWNHTFRAYNGTVNNLHAFFVPFDAHLTAIRQEYVHRLSAVTFIVEGNMHSETGAMEGKARRKYSLVLNHLGKPNVLPRTLRQQAVRFYSHEELWNKRAVYMSTEIANTEEVKCIIKEAYDRVHNSRAVAEAAERKNVTHPVQGGLPGLGKSSR